MAVGSLLLPRGVFEGATLKHCHYAWKIQYAGARQDKYVQHEAKPNVVAICLKTPSEFCIFRLHVYVA